MKLKKVLAASLTSLALLSSSINVVNANIYVDKRFSSEYKATKTTFAYNSKGKKVGKPYLKGWTFTSFGPKKIKGKKFYKVGKNKYILASNVKKVTYHVYEPDYSKPLTSNWQSKHLVDTSGDIYEQTWKAYQLHGDDRLEAFKEIAKQKDMLTDNGEIFGGLDPFESMIKTDYYNHMAVVTGKPFTEDTLH